MLLQPTRRMRCALVTVMMLLSCAATAWADPQDTWLAALARRPDHAPLRIDWRPASDAVPLPAHLAISMTGDRGGVQSLHAAAVEHSDAYRTRAKIHKYASVATLPLFVAELALGQSLYNTPSGAGAGAARAAHAAVGAGIIGLFGVNTVTGMWNTWGREGRRDKDGRTLRLVHGLLMMAADAGFVATWAAGPSGEGRREAAALESGKATHRALAVTSIGIGTAGYVLMLLGN